MVIAAKNNDKDETVYEITDLIYHTLVMMANQGITRRTFRRSWTSAPKKPAI